MDHLCSRLLESFAKTDPHTPGHLAAFFGGSPTLDLALGGVQLPLPVLQWSSRAERTEILKERQILILTAFTKDFSTPKSFCKVFLKF